MHRSPDQVDEVALGSIVPDLAAWGRFRLVSRNADGTALGLGIAIHHQTDTEFHSDPWFVAIQTKIRSDLEALGVGRGPARACAHVGTEMLIDGELCADPYQSQAARAALAVISAAPDGLNQIVSADAISDWNLHLNSVASFGVPPDYHDPVAVASRLARILRGRPRLKLDPDCVGVVADILDRHHPEIGDTAHHIVDRVAQQLERHY